MHLQVYPLLLSVHFPPCRQGLGWQYDFAEERIYSRGSVHIQWKYNIFLRTVILLSSGKKIKLKKAATTATTKNSNISAVKGMYKLDL